MFLYKFESETFYMCLYIFIYLYSVSVGLCNNEEGRPNEKSETNYFWC